MVYVVCMTSGVDLCLCPAVACCGITHPFFPARKQWQANSVTAECRTVFFVCVLADVRSSIHVDALLCERIQGTSSKQGLGCLAGFRLEILAIFDILRRLVFFVHSN